MKKIKHHKDFASSAQNDKPYGLLRKSGDAGTSDLFSGEKVSKSSLRIDALGELDELGCVIGIARLYTRSKFQSDFLRIQRLLFTIGSEIATLGQAAQKLPQTIPNFARTQYSRTKSCKQNVGITPPKALNLDKIQPGGPSGEFCFAKSGIIDPETVQWLEHLIQTLLTKAKLPQGFILSGSTRASSYLHLARAVTRRCERRLVRLHETKQLKNKTILAFINRLSVYFFVLSVAHDRSPILVKK